MYSLKEKISNNKRVVYTVLFGDKYVLKDMLPENMEENTDYICFTNTGARLKNWKVIHVDSYYNNEVLDYKYFKFNPHKIFPHYEESVWVDSRCAFHPIQSNKFGKVFEYFYRNNPDNKDICLNRHPFNFSSEIKRCLDFGKEFYINLVFFKLKFLKEGLTEDEINKLPLGCLFTIYRKHHSRSSIILSEGIFDNMKDVTRDQLVFPYVVFKNQELSDDIKFIPHRVELESSPYYRRLMDLFPKRNVNNYITIANIFLKKRPVALILFFGPHRTKVFKKEYFKISLLKEIGKDRSEEILKIPNKYPFIFVYADFYLENTLLDIETALSRLDHNGLILIHVDGLKYNVWKSQHIYKLLFSMKKREDLKTYWFDMDVRHSFILVKKGFNEHYEIFRNIDIDKVKFEDFYGKDIGYKTYCEIEKWLGEDFCSDSQNLIVQESQR